MWFPSLPSQKLLLIYVGCFGTFKSFRITIKPVASPPPKIQEGIVVEGSFPASLTSPELFPMRCSGGRVGEGGSGEGCLAALEPWFPYLKVYQNPLKDVLEYRLLDPHLRDPE